jgi:hypothetical protein
LERISFSQVSWGERDYGPAAQGAASFHTTRWTIVMRAAQFTPVRKDRHRWIQTPPKQ